MAKETKNVNDWLNALNTLGQQKNNYTELLSRSPIKIAPAPTTTIINSSVSSSTAFDFNSFLQAQLQRISPTDTITFPPSLVEFSDCEGEDESEDISSQCGSTDRLVLNI